MMTADGRRCFLEETEYEDFDTRMRKTSGFGETQSDDQDPKDHNRKIVHIFGCPNSGKTTLRKALADKHPDYPDYCIDDFRRRYGDGSFEGEINAQIRFGEAMMHGGFFECSGAGRFARYHLSVCRYRPQYIVVLDAPVDICISRIVEGKYIGIPFPFTDDDEHLIRTVSDYLSSERFARIREGIPTLWLDAGNPLEVQIEEVERFTGLALPEEHRWDRERDDMRTIQEYLGELDVQRLLDHYFYDYPIDYELLPRKDLPVSQIKQRYRDRMAQFIDLLRGLAIEKNDGDHIGILFAYKCIGYRNAGRSIDFGLVHADDAVEKGTGAPVYCYELTGLEEIAGFFVADNAFTQKHLYELLSDLLHQASFFGLDKDERKKAIDDALRSFEEAEKEESIPWEEVKREFQEKYGLEFDEDTPEEQQLRSAAYTTAHAFDEHCMKKEMSSIIDTLRRMRRS